MAGYSVDPNRELVALGAASVAASFVGGYPVAGALSRTAVNAQAGAATPGASLVSGLTVICALLALTPLLTSMPLAALSAIIVVSARRRNISTNAPENIMNATAACHTQLRTLWHGDLSLSRA